MRFDDRLKTVLKGALPEGLAAAMQWRQVVDLLAQKPGVLMNEDVQNGLTRLRDLHERVSEHDRLSGVTSLKGRLRSAPLLVYLSADSEAVCRAAVEAADLPPEIWADIRPQLPDNINFEENNPVSNETEVIEKLIIGTSSDVKQEIDIKIATQEIVQDDAMVIESQTSSQISDLMKKIADYQRKRKPQASQSEHSDSPHRSVYLETLERIRFETDDSGTITWAEGPPRGAIVGVTIANPAFDDGPGPDAYGAAAFRQKMPLENARMRLCGASIVEGDWRMSAIPYFEESTGRFKGYRGVMRRPNAAEDAGQNNIDTQRREQLQQLIHELRTPLNAIIGFSEIIEQQLFGPVSFEYRTLSRSIMDEATRLLSGFEDLDDAARVDSGEYRAVSGTTQPTWLFERLSQRLQSLTQSKMVELRINKAEPLRDFALENESVERIFSRLLSAIIIACDQNEELHSDLRTRIGAQPVNIFSISRPSRIIGVDEVVLLDPSQGMEGDNHDAPLLGLGFSLRLVRNLAEAASGSLTIGEHRIMLSLPAASLNEIGARGLERD